jgi:hypothetical protein
MKRIKVRLTPESKAKLEKIKTQVEKAPHKNISISLTDIKLAVILRYALFVGYQNKETAPTTEGREKFFYEIETSTVAPAWLIDKVNEEADKTGIVRAPLFYVLIERGLDIVLDELLQEK